MRSTQPLVSAVITTHNRATLLPRAVDSVIAQTYGNMELIIVDDGSTDDTATVVEEYKQYEALTYIKNKQSLGAPKARNRGIEAARGKFVAGLDDDDEWHPERIALLMTAYSDEFSCVTSDTKMVYPNGEAVWKKKKEVELDTLLYSNQIGNQVLARKDRLLDVGVFDEQLKAAQDYDLWIRLCAKYGPVKNVQQPLQNIYMDHRQQRMTDQSSFEGYLQFYTKHKHRMNRKQRAYQLYKIRRAQGKREQMSEYLKWVPRHRYFKELKRMIANKIWDA